MPPVSLKGGLSRTNFLNIHIPEKHITQKLLFLKRTIAMQMLVRPKFSFSGTGNVVGHHSWQTHLACLE